MNYFIDDKGQITLENQKYWILSGELNNLSIDDLDNILSDIENVLEGKYESSSFSENVIIVNFDKKVATIEDYEGIIGEESIHDIYEMLKKIRNTLSNAPS